MGDVSKSKNAAAGCFHFLFSRLPAGKPASGSKIKNVPCGTFFDL